MPGTMRERSKNRWYLEVCIGTDLRGIPNRYNKTIHGTKKEAEKELAKFYAACSQGKITKQSSLTVSDMCNMVMDKLVIHTLKRNTIRGYKICQKRIDTTLGNRKIAKLKPIHIQEWVNGLQDYNKGLSSKTIKNTYSFLSMCFESMVMWEELDKSPCVRIRLPKLDQKEVKSLSKDEVIQFLNLLDSLSEEKQDYKVAALIALFCGLRRGEILGIDEETVDLDKMEARIIKARYIDDTGVYVDTPKSGASYRIIVFPAEVGDEVRRLITYHKKQKLKLGSKWQDSPSLIKGVYGGDMYPNNLWDWLTEFLAENGLRHFSFHTLRHTYTSMLAWMGKDISEISKSLGHSKKSTTLNTYMHMFQDLSDAKRKTAADLSEQIIRLKSKS